MFSKMQQIQKRGAATRLLGMGLMALSTVTAQAQAQDAETYVRANEGAQVRVFQDMNARAIGAMAGGDILRVHRSDVFDLPDGRRLTWHEVSSPKGFPVWVYGEYLSATEAEGVYAVTGNAVRMRPMPESSIASYPLRTTLQSGERVMMIERGDATAPLSTDWVKVWSPASARAWINAMETTPEPDSAAGKASWAETVRVLPSAPVMDATEKVEFSSSEAAPEAVEPDETAPDPQVPAEAYRSLNYGNTLLENARKKGKAATEADFQPAIRAYDVVIDMTSAQSQVAMTASRQRELALMLQEVAALRDDLNHSERYNKERLRELQEQQREEQVAGTTSWGRFTGRGWVESSRDGKEVRWYLRWAGDVVYEIDCGSGRYNLGMFEGYQVGVSGTTMRAATLSTDEMIGHVAMLDVSRIEVIDGGRRR